MNIFFRRCTAVLTAAVLVSAVLSGCGSDNSKAKKKITVSWWGGESRHEATMKAVEAFENKNSDIDIDVQFGAWDGWENAMTAAFYAGTQSDVIQINWNWLNEYNRDGNLFLDISSVSDYFSLSEYDPEKLKLCTVNDTLYAIPVSVTGRIFYWNEAVFEKAGITHPVSLSELYRAGEIFRDRLGDDYYPLALGEYDRMILMVNYLGNIYGKPWISDGVLNYSEEELIKGTEFIDSLEKAHVIPSISEISGDGAVTFDKSSKWMNGSYAGIYEWDSAAAKYLQSLSDGSRFTVGEYFEDMGGSKGGYSKISVAFAISKNTKYPEECARFLDFILNDPEGAVLMGVERGIPLSRSAVRACDEAGLLNGTEAEATRRVQEWSNFSLDINFEDPKLKVNPEGVYYDAFSGLSYGDYSAEEAAHIISEGVKDVLSD